MIIRYKLSWQKVIYLLRLILTVPLLCLIQILWTVYDEDHVSLNLHILIIIIFMFIIVIIIIIIIVKLFKPSGFGLTVFLSIRHLHDLA